MTSSAILDHSFENLSGSLTSASSGSPRSSCSSYSSSFQESLLADDDDTYLEVKRTLQMKDRRPKSTLHLKPQAQASVSFQERVVALTLMSDSYHELNPPR